MLFGELLIERKLVTREQISDALKRQKEGGGRLGEHLVSMGAIDQEALDTLIAYVPPVAKNIEETGLSKNFLIAHLMRIFYVHSYETVSDIAKVMKLSTTVTTLLMEAAVERGLLEIVGAMSASLASELRHQLTSKGKAAAAEAMEQSQYIGPAPIPFARYLEQVQRQAIQVERIDRSVLQGNFSEMILPENFVDYLGPAVNSGRSILLYGPPGNGKTTIAEAIARSFQDMVFIPHAVEVDSQIIKIFDPTLHNPVVIENEEEKEDIFIQKRGDNFDARWVPCKRPIMIAGGELTLDSLDLRFSHISKFYEAPLQMKAMNGIFIIDDFGRQRVEPNEILNRWIITLEQRVDYLSLHTGKKFQIPFDELLIFSTNLVPEDLMDDAFLRRIPYKIEMRPPSPELYEQIFKYVCKKNKIELPDDLIQYIDLVFYMQNGIKQACFHPKFIVDRVIDMCRYRGEATTLKKEYVLFALSNLTPNADDVRRLSETPADLEEVKKLIATHGTTVHSAAARKSNGVAHDKEPGSGTSAAAGEVVAQIKRAEDEKSSGNGAHDPAAQQKPQDEGSSQVRRAEKAPGGKGRSLFHAAE